MKFWWVLLLTSAAYADEKAILTDPVFLGLSGFDGRPFALGTSKNGRLARHPEGIQAESAESYLSAHLKKFRADPEYACRFPAHFRYFKKVLAESPRVECKPAYKVKLGGPVGQTGVTDLDPSRILEVRLMAASPGNELPSRWGHLMLHLVRCPDSMPVGSDCRKATASHIVVSFRGQVDDPKIDNWKGVTGQYRLLPFFFRLPKSLREYTYEQGRSLTSYAIRLSREQKDFMIERLLESFWAYDSGYNFLTRNCSTEIQDMLGTVAFDESTRKPYDRNYLPNDVLQTLLDSGILNQEPGTLMVFESAEKQVETFLKIVKWDGGLAAYAQTPQAERKKWIQSKLTRFSSKEMRAGFRLAEDVTLARMEKKLQKERLATARTPEEITWAWQQFPGQRMGQGYGIPLAGDPTLAIDEVTGREEGSALFQQTKISQEVLKTREGLRDFH